MNIFEKLKERGFDTVPKSFYDIIGVWKSWYDGDVKDFHRYKVYNGSTHISCRRYTMGMAKKVSEDWANLLMNEKVKITLEGQKEQDFFDSVCEENSFRVKSSEMQEMKAALGTAAYVPRITGVSIDPASGELSRASGKIRLDYCTAENIFPLAWENGKVTECAFASRKTVKNEQYVYLQVHHFGSDGKYIIDNVLYRDNSGSLSEVTLADVPGFQNVPATIYTGSDKRQFAIDKLNIVNNVDASLPMGIAVFANAIDQLKGVDIAYDSYVNEFVLGKKRIMVKPQATRDLDGNPYFDPNDTIYYVLPEDTSNSGSIVDPVDMNLRTAEHNAGMQDMLNVLSSKCGFGENHYRYNQGSIATATQVVSENSSMFRTIKKHEIILEDVLKELCRIILRLGNTYLHAGLNENVEISIDFDDSIIEDKQVEFARDMQMLSAGIINPYEFRMKWMNEDEATAKAALPGMEDMTTEKQDEVE